MVASRLGRRIVVTGGAGFIGTHTVRQLLASDYEVLVVDDLRHGCGEEVPAPANLLVANMAGPEAHDAMVAFRPWALIHLAAQGGVNRSLMDPAADATNNVAGTAAVLRAMVDAGCMRMVFASSGGAIYGRARRLPSEEHDRAQPLAPYGAAKLAGEGYLGMFRRTFGVRFTAMRYGNVYGPYQDGTGEAGLVAITCQRLLQGLAPVVTGDGEQTRDFVYVGDVARANVLALATAIDGPINIGTGTPTSVNAIVDTLRSLVDHAPAPERAAARPGEVRSNFLNVTRARKRLGWSAEVDLTDGLRRTLKAFSDRDSTATHR